LPTIGVFFKEEPMALQSPFFGKRDTEVNNQRRPTTMAQPNNPHGTYAVPAPTPAHVPTPAPMAPEASSPVVGQAGQGQSRGAAPEGGSKLTVGPNIKLKGVEITDCDTLFVEGTVEATMDSRLMQIAECGAFKGAACIDIAEIHGRFDGDLTVRDKLMIYATGKVTGKVRYGKLVIEEGGQLSGEVVYGTAEAAKPSQQRERVGLQAA
jgi:cytoskeletal protein CcmA (bactofilin family)